MEVYNIFENRVQFLLFGVIFVASKYKLFCLFGHLLALTSYFSFSLSYQIVPPFFSILYSIILTTPRKSTYGFFQKGDFSTKVTIHNSDLVEKMTYINYCLKYIFWAP